MLRPFLLVGVGGSGGKTLRVVRDDLTRRLAQAGWRGELPRAWQFLHVDVPTTADGNDPDLPPQLPDRDYQGLVTKGIDYRTIDQAMVQGAREYLRDAVATWRPDPNKVNVPASKGAGQYRTLGRIITVAGMSRIQEALQHARRALTGAEVVGELGEITRLLGGTAAPATAEPTVIVVSSIAGGSGAGAIVDVCDVIRSFPEKWSDEIVGLLYAPDVFDYLPEEARRGVRPNSIAALAEILNGYWNSVGPSEATSALFARYGVTLGAARRSGPRYPFLIGSRNENVSYKTQNDIYRALGRSLASWVASSTLQDRISGYLQGNWTSAASSLPDRLPLRTAGTETPFSAIGSARVGLGRDRFADYASEHLARSSVERFLRRHEEMRRPQDDRPENQLVRDTAEDAFPAFLQRSGLNERGDAQNDIIDALRPATQQDDAKALAAHILEIVRRDVPAKGQRVDELRRVVVTTVRDNSAAFHTRVRDARVAQARRWVESVQQHLVAETARSIAASGAPVTEQLLRRLAAELRYVRDELHGEAGRYQRWAQDLTGEVNKALDEPDHQLLLATTESLDRAVGNGVNTLHLQAEAELRELAASIIPDLVDSLVDPLAQAVGYAAERLGQELRTGPDGRPSLMSQWPEGDAIPARLRNAPNEFLLDDPEQYPAILADLVERTIGAREGADVGAADARRSTDMQVLLGVEDVAADAQGLVRRLTAWVPQDHRIVASATAVPTRAAFEVRSSGEAVLDRANAWLTREGTPSGSYVREGLRDYLGEKNVSPKEQARRLQRFEGQLVAALNAAAPLVSINAAVLVQVHAKDHPSYQTAFSEIPLPDKSEAKATVRRVLESRGQWTEEIAKAFSDGNGGFIDVFTHLGEPYEPVVFDSLMRPVASDWGAKSKQLDSRTEFWRWRRARPLTEFVPVSPEVLDEMIRGWFVAGTLRHLSVDDDSASIYVPADTGAGGQMFDFPRPTLRTLALDGPNGLAVVLESLVLALVEVNATESLTPVRAYSRLVELGGGGGGAGDEEILSGELKRFVLRGENRNPDAPAADASWEVRRDAAIKRFESLERSYTEEFEKAAARTELLEFPPIYDLRRQVVAALGDLRRSVEGLAPAPDTGSAWA